MVRVLIAPRRTILRHQAARTNPAGLLITAGLVLASALGTIWLGLVRNPSPAGATSVLALVFALWPSVLTRRMDASARPARSGTSHLGGRAALPRTPAGAVAAKEIRMWGRDPVRPARSVAVGAGHRARGAGRRGRAGSARVAGQRPAPRRDRQSHPGLVAEGSNCRVCHCPHRPRAGHCPAGGRAGGLAGWRWHLGWLSWAAVPVGLASGTWLALGLGRRAIARLEREQVRILKVLADAAR